ncbi:MAG: hemin uptake protein HemP [Pseudomonadota bacterium]
MTHDAAANDPVPASYDARELTAGQTTAHIVLDGKVYTLRITRAGKLILTK